jgi:hypothetical protein
MGDAESTAAGLRMLRQGRGNGFREASRGGVAAAGDVVSCVVDDPRWDRQVEQRDHYYASLLVRLDTDIAPIAGQVFREGEKQDECDLWLPIGVLAELARRAHEPAQSALAEAIRRGRWWRLCLDALEAVGGEALVCGVVRPEDVRSLVHAVGVDELVDAVQTVAAPWEAWAAEVPALRFVPSARTRPNIERKPMSGPVHWIAARLREPVDPVIRSSLTTAELLGLAVAPDASRQIEKILRTRTDASTTQTLCHAASAGTPEQRVVALRVLGERGCPDFVGEADDFLRNESRQTHAECKEHRTRHAYLRYLERLPADATLEPARRWFAEPWPLSLAAERILAQHATRDDRLMLEDAGATALTSDDMYRLCSVVDALAAVGASESIPLLGEVYARAPYSYARRGVVKALVPHVADELARELLEEALWDCEVGSRELACGAVSSSQIAIARRLAELAGDDFEEAGVRTAARQATTTPR